MTICCLCGFNANEGAHGVFETVPDPATGGVRVILCRPVVEVAYPRRLGVIQSIVESR